MVCRACAFNIMLWINRVGALVPCNSAWFFGTCDHWLLLSHALPGSLWKLPLNELTKPYQQMSETLGTIFILFSYNIVFREKTSIAKAKDQRRHNVDTLELCTPTVDKLPPFPCHTQRDELFFFWKGTFRGQWYPSAPQVGPGYTKNIAPK